MGLSTSVTFSIPEFKPNTKETTYLNNLTTLTPFAEDVKINGALPIALAYFLAWLIISVRSSNELLLSNKSYFVPTKTANASELRFLTFLYQFLRLFNDFFYVRSKVKINTCDPSADKGIID